MRVWFTSDTHFYHENIIRFCNRPFWVNKDVYEDEEYRGTVPAPDLEAMNAALVENWNGRVKPGDLVYHLGDFCFGAPHKWNDVLDKLNGDIVLVKGNHDIKNLRNNEMMARFLRIEEECYEYVRASDGNLYVLWLSHYPPTGSDNDPRELFRPKRDRYYDLSLCGRVHTSWKHHKGSGTINVGSDVWDYKPISLEDILVYSRSQIRRYAYQ